jgi:hypothetical protein
LQTSATYFLEKTSRSLKQGKFDIISPGRSARENPYFLERNRRNLGLADPLHFPLFLSRLAAAFAGFFFR